MTAVDAKTRRFRLTLILVFLVCAGPFILAWLWFAFIGTPGLDRTTNVGQLVYPAEPLENAELPVIASRGGEDEEEVFGERWTVVYVAGQGCEAECRDVMWSTRQIRLSLGRDMRRVRRVLLEPAEEADAAFYRNEHEDLSVLDLDSSAARDFIRQLEREDGLPPETAGRLYIIDPLGNFMMYFPPGFDPDDFMDDMQRLLRVSQIG